VPTGLLYLKTPCCFESGFRLRDNCCDDALKQLEPISRRLARETLPLSVTECPRGTKLRSKSSCLRYALATRTVSLEGRL
jgi:hypothetical protein